MSCPPGLLFYHGGGFFMSIQARPTEELFWIKVEKSDGCWLWKACRDKTGYGVFHMNQKKLPAHRYSWMLHKGPIPEGLWVLHRCDNPPCVNPAHLFLGTVKDNVADMVAKNRQGCQSGSENPRSKLTESDIPKIFRCRSNGLTQQQIANLFGVKQPAIGKILTRKGWTHVANRH